jgi:hypothetical protein
MDRGTIHQEVIPMRVTLDPRWVCKIGGTAAVVGALLGMVGNLVHPATPIGDRQGVAMVIAESDGWVPIHLAIVLGIVLMLAGLFAIRHSIEDGLPEVLASLGLVFGVAGATIGLVLVILDGVAARQLAEEWAASSVDGQGMALSLVHVNETINLALASLFNFIFAAATFILFGLAVALSDPFPRWLGWVAVFAGTLSAVAGTIQAYTGEPTGASRVLTIIGPSVITLWLLLMGVKLLRRTRDFGPRRLEVSSRSAA